MNTLLACPIVRRPPGRSTSSLGLPVAMMARPSVHSRMSSGRASARSPGFDSGRMIGTGECLATSRTSASVNAPRLPVAPMSTDGLRARATATGIRQLLRAHSGLDEPALIDRERPLVLGQVRPPEVDQTGVVHQGDRRTVRACRGAHGAEVLPEHPGDADRRRAGAQEQESFPGQPTLLAPGRKEAAQDDSARSLDVVVEARQSMAVALEDPQRVVLLEVLPLDDGGGKDTPHRPDERLHHLVVGLTPQTGRAEAEIERVVEELRSVGPDVERDGQRPGRVDAGRRRVQGELADRDRHAARALVAEAQDPLVVGHHDQPDIVVGRGPQDVVDTVDVRRRDPHAARPAQDVAELLAGAPDRRRVDDRQELLQVFGQHPVEQGLVPILERRQADETLEIVGLAADVLELERDLLLDRHDPGGQQPRSENASRSSSEKAISLVEQGLADEVPTATADRGIASGRLEGGTLRVTVGPPIGL